MGDYTSYLSGRNLSADSYSIYFCVEKDTSAFKKVDIKKMLAVAVHQNLFFLSMPVDLLLKRTQSLVLTERFKGR